MATTIKKTVAPSGGDFIDLSSAVAWFKANYANFVTSDIIGEIEITGTWSSDDTYQADISTITTGPNNYLYIHATGSARHPGYWSNSAYRITKSTSAAVLITGVSHVIIDGIQILVPDAQYSYGIRTTGTFSVSGSSLIFRNLLIKAGGATSTSVYGAYLDYSSNQPNVYMYNCAIYGFGTNSDNYGVYNYSNLRIYNCVITGGYYGLRNGSGGVCTAKNCYVATSGSGGCYAGTITKTTCASSDSTGSSGLTNKSLSSAGFVSITSGSENFHLASTSSPLYHTGTDTHTDSAPMNFTTDIDGDAYYDTGGVRSIGIDEIPTVSGTNYVIVVNE